VKRKLNLRRETLRTLSDADFARVDGGSPNLSFIGTGCSANPQATCLCPTPTGPKAPWPDPGSP
jgi:hypothetical protein